MVLKIKYEEDEPPKKGYYLVKVNPKYAFDIEKDKYPEVAYWNGEEWQNMSDDDAFHMPGLEEPISFDKRIYSGWCEVEI